MKSSATACQKLDRFPTSGPIRTGGGTNGTPSIGLRKSCAASQVLQWNGSAWAACASVTTGTVTGVTAGSDLIGGGTAGNVKIDPRHNQSLKGRALENFIRDAATSYRHETCTAKMGQDDMSVVDGKLKVYGVENLRIADGSIMPRITVGNTMAPCVIIGEGAAEILRG